jgi:hypothetical protein
VAPDACRIAAREVEEYFPTFVEEYFPTFHVHSAKIEMAPAIVRLFHD